MFDPTSYPPALQALLPTDRLPSLGPGEPNYPRFDQLRRTTTEELFDGHVVQDREMANACRAGLWLAHDFLDESHRISQELKSTTGSYWHGMMHRREPDYSNAKYWFRRVGDHPVFEPLVDAARRLLARQPQAALDQLAWLGDTAWDPFRFVDVCQTAYRAETSPLGLVCRQIQQAEWQLLFDYSYRQAVEP